MQDIFPSPFEWDEWPARGFRIFRSADRRLYFGSRGFIGAMWLCLQFSFRDFLIAQGLRPTREQLFIRLVANVEGFTEAMERAESALVAFGRAWHPTNDLSA
jgi:hypothetical protein